MRYKLLTILACGALLAGGTAVAQSEPDIDHVTVREGEGLWAVARRLCPDNIGAQADALRRANPWHTVGLHPGTVLHVPVGSCPATTTTTVAPTTSTTSTTVAPTSTTTTAPITVPPPPGGFPTAATTGVPAGWQPVQTINGQHRVTQAGAVVEDLRINGELLIFAPNVTVRRVEIVGGRIENYPGSTCNNGLLVEDTTIRWNESKPWDFYALGSGGYTARRVKIDGPPEGFRAQGKNQCGPIFVEDSWARAVFPTPCGDWHGDALQAYGGNDVHVTNSYLELVIGPCGGTAPFWVPGNQGNEKAFVDGLIVNGGGFPFRMGVPGSVRNLHIVENSWVFGPVDVNCSALSVWQASISRLDTNGQPIIQRSAICTGNGL